MADGGGKWQFWVDRGGTFTDIVARTPDGTILTRKILSVNPGAYDDAALEGIRQLLNVPRASPIPAAIISSVRMGTTVATNALLERKGAPTLLVMTAGLEDQLEIGTQARSGIFAKRIIKPEMLYARVTGARERVRADGTIEVPLDQAHLRTVLAAAFEDGLRAVAIVFMHGYAHPEHERQAARIAGDVGFTQISVSHEVSPLIKIVSRGDTTVADAYLSPVLRSYTVKIAEALQTGAGHECPHVLFMASSGGLKPAARFQGRDAILSGPAGGVAGMVESARHAGFEKVIGFDMGGTSTDVSHFAGEYERTFESEVAGVRLRVPMMRVHTVAAGGGSILHYDGSRFSAGPDSAGSDPGPMCYRRGGPLTVTDANVMLGKLKPEFFPPIFGPGGDQPIDVEAVRAAFLAMSLQIGDGRSPEQIADGFIRIAAGNMSNAIKKLSVERGYDITGYALNCFGSAGGQHACIIAGTLGIETVLIHPLSGLLSAFGIGLAPIRASREQSIEAVLSAAALQGLESLAWRLGEAATEELLDQGVAHDAIALTTWLHLRYDGSDAAIPVLLAEPDIMQRDFENTHLQRFGFVSPEKQIFAAAIEVEALAGGVLDATSGSWRSTADVDRKDLDRKKTAGQPNDAGLAPRTLFYSQGAWHDAAIHRRETLVTGALLYGPALVIEPHQTVVVEPGWQLKVTDRNDLVMTRNTPRVRENISRDADPVLLEVFNNLYMAIAEQMGEALRNTAQSVNIKERLDFSCAVFDAQGSLVANAPHLPVHLGSMDRSVETIIRERAGTMKPGDVYMLNAPYNGGTHLPDITVVTPVFGPDDNRLLFFVASRGHHADIGGLTPGSMTPRAAHIEEEGVYIDNVTLVSGGRFLESETRGLLAAAKHPARNPDQNIADLKAQVAANATGAAELGKMVEHFGLDVVNAYMQHVQNNAEESVRRLIAGLEDGHFRVETDQGAAVEVRISVNRQARTVKVDFTGTSPQQPNNFNAPEPVTRAAVLYVFRVMLDAPIPINAGCLRPLEIVIPDGSMLKPSYPAAVAAGNVETSQIVTNCLFAALGALGSAQGTMNNLTFGNDHVQYYETICSGAPAGPGFDGAAAVHVHMTNTRLTDPEILELRYPVLLEEFRISRGSGGRGRWTSGDGTRRVIRFLEPMPCAILSGYRKMQPFGLQGGQPGECGSNQVRRANGHVENLNGCAETRLEAGDAIVIVTPTGGGFGSAPD